MKRYSFAAVPSLIAVLIALAIPATSAAAAEFSLELNLAGSGEGAVSCKVGAGPLEECEAKYPEGTALTILAEAEWGSQFAEWEGDCDTTSGPECKVTMNADKAIEAFFDLEEFEVTLQSEGTGEGLLECQVDGGPYEPCPETETYPWETELRVFAEAEEGSEFLEWEGDCSGIEAECVLSVEEALEATAIFVAEPPFELAIATAGTGEGEVSCEVEGGEAEPCEAEYEEGVEVALVPEAEAGSEFTGWSGDCTGTGPCELTMDEDKAVTASFDLEPEPEEFTLSVAKAGTGSGTVTSSPAGIDCGSVCEAAFEEGTEVTLTATPASGSNFTGWSGACTGTAVCKATMSQARAVSATFTAESVTPPPPPPPPVGAGIAKVAATAKVKGGKAQLKLTCTGEGSCKGSLKLTAKVKQGKKTKTLTIGKGSFNLGKGAKTTLKVKLSSPARQALAKGPLKAKVKGSGVAASSLKLKA